MLFQSKSLLWPQNSIAIEPNWGKSFWRDFYFQKRLTLTYFALDGLLFLLS